MADLSSDHLTVHVNCFPGTNNTSGKIQPAFENNYAIVWLIKGRAEYYLDFRRHRFDPDSMIIISKNQSTSFHFTEPASRYVVITFSDGMVHAASENVRRLLSFCIREHFEGKQILRLAEEDTLYLGGLVEQLHTIGRRWQGQLKNESLFYFLQLFLTYCHQLREQQSHYSYEASDETVISFTTLLEEHFRTTHKVNYYTDRLNLTYNVLTRYTTNYCGKTPKEIIVERVLLETKRLLAGTATPIKEIAYQLGFDEPTNMVKFFKKYTGSTPVEFRREAKLAGQKPAPAPAKAAEINFA